MNADSPLPSTYPKMCVDCDCRFGKVFRCVYGPVAGGEAQKTGSADQGCRRFCKGLLTGETRTQRIRRCVHRHRRADAAIAAAASTITRAWGRGRETTHCFTNDDTQPTRADTEPPSPVAKHGVVDAVPLEHHWRLLERRLTRQWVIQAAVSTNSCVAGPGPAACTHGNH